MDYGEIKSVNGAQDIEKAQEPKRPGYALDGVTQRRTPRREHGGADRMGWILDREPHAAHPARAWRRGEHLSGPVALEPQGP